MIISTYPIDMNGYLSYLALHGPQGLVIFDHPADYERFGELDGRAGGSAQISRPWVRNASPVGGGGSGWAAVRVTP